jgi:hypothetical protein
LRGALFAFANFEDPGSGILVLRQFIFICFIIFIFSGNGYIEGTELDGFLREFVASVNSVDVGPEVINYTFIGTL